LVRQLKANWTTGFLLPDSCAFHRVAARRYIIDANGYHITGSQPAVDREVEQREIPLATLDPQLGSDRPDVTWPRPRIRANELALVPRGGDELACQR
jgi:hypothetical protein